MFFKRDEKSVYLLSQSRQKLLCLLIGIFLLFEFLPQNHIYAQSGNEQIVYEYLTSSGVYLEDGMHLSRAAACGILANIWAESNFDPNASGDNDTSYGLCGFHDTSAWVGLKSGLINYCTSFASDHALSEPELYYTTIEGQMRYLQYLFETDYTDTFNRISTVSDTAEGAYYAAYTMCYYFERPVNKSASGRYRGAQARDVFWSNHGGEHSVYAGERGVTLSNAVYPQGTIPSGSFILRGNLHSNYPLYDVRVYVTDIDGNMEIQWPSTFCDLSDRSWNYTDYDIHLDGADDNLRFASLGSGSHIYHIDVRDAVNQQEIQPVLSSIFAIGSPTVCEVSYDLQGGTMDRTEDSAVYQASVTLPTPIRTGYTFLGWHNGTEMLAAGSSYQLLKKTQTLTASWKAKDVEVVYDANGGSCSKQKEKVPFDSTITLPQAQREYYTFKGWSDGTKSYGAGSTYKVQAEQLKFTAQWESNLMGIEIKAPNKTTYYKGDALNTQGMTVYAVYSNGQKQDVTVKASVSGFDSITSGLKTIDVSYKDKGASFQVSVFAFKSVSLSLDGRVIINFYADFPGYAARGETPGVLFFAHEPTETEITQAYAQGQGITAAGTAQDGSLMFAYEKLAAKEMNDTIYAVLYNVQNSGGVSFGKPSGISAAQYVKMAFGSYANNTQLQTMLVDMLNYGSCAQKFFNYRIDTLAIGVLSTAQQAKQSTSLPTLSSAMSLKRDELVSDVVTISSASLSLENEISINYYVTLATNTDIQKAEILVYDEYTEGVTYDASNAKSAESMVKSGQYYAGFVRNIAAKDMRKPYYARMHFILADGTELFSGVACYSVETYAYQVRNGSYPDALKALTEAMMRYGDSASKYFQGKS